MKEIAIIGKGSVAKALGGRFERAGYQVTFGVRAQTVQTALLIHEAIAKADIIVLAIPYQSALEVVRTHSQQLADKIVVDVTNPVAPDWSPMKTETASACEDISQRAPQASVVKAFNTIFSDVMAKPLSASSTFIASDDAAAGDEIFLLARAAGFAPVKVGGLDQARHLEALAHLNIAIAVGQNGGTQARIQFERLD
jgi:8-hydroxy-5-deazaflavin:NADPH oxidoreductase